MELVVQRYKRKKSGDDNVDWNRNKKKRKKKVDWISQLPDDVLLLILSRLSTKEAIRMSVVSKRWKHVWKQMPHLVLNTQRSINPRMLRRPGDSNPDAELTRIINNHYGHLERCEITHYSNKGVHELLKTWIQKVETRNLTLVNRNDRTPCSFRRCSLSHPSLMSLSLKSYYLSSSTPFNNWPNSNIKTLKLLSIFSKVGVFNKILAFCPSLEVLVLNKIKFSDTWGGRRSCLEIKNSKLKFLEINSIKGIDKVIVSAPNLDILVAKDIYAPGREFLLQSPNLQFNLSSYLGGNMLLHIIYNISKEKNNGHEDLVNRIGELRGEKYPILSVAVDLMNETEVERLRQVMSLLSHRLETFDIKFKGNNSPNPSEGEIQSWQKKLWVNEDFFPNAKFSADGVWIYNFKGSKEEIAFVSCLMRQRKVKRRILIYPKLFSTSNRSHIKAAVAKLLQEVQSEDHQKVTIKYFRDFVMIGLSALG